MTKGCKAEDLSAKIQITWAEVQYAQIYHAIGPTRAEMKVLVSAFSIKLLWK